MPSDFSANPDDDRTTSDPESSMFAPVPAWERNKKRRGFGSGRVSRVAPEPRSFAADEDEDQRIAPAPQSAAPRSAAMADTGRAFAFEPMDPEVRTEPEEGVFAGTPTYATATRAKSNTAPVMVAAGIILLGGVAAAGWYYTQSRDTGVAQLTPGSASTTTTTTSVAPANDQLAQASTPQAALPGAAATASAPPPTAKAATTTTTTRSASPSVTHRTTAVARAVPVSRNATSAGSDAAATLPAGPQPYSGAAQAPAASSTAAPPLVLNLPPAQAAPTAAPPASTPAPVQTAPAPTTAAPPPTQTPPQ